MAGTGVATALLEELVRQRPAGIDELVTTVTADNQASLSMLRRLGATTVTPAGINRLDVVVDLPLPDPLPDPLPGPLPDPLPDPPEPGDP